MAGVAFFACSLGTRAYAADIKPSAAPVNFQSKQLTHDDAKQTVTAIGDVELVQGDRIIRADKMVYHLDTDKVEAIGNVSLLDEKGDVTFAEYASLSTDMKDGFVQGLLSLLSDGSRFTAVEAKRENGNKTTLTDAAYTPCKVCEDDPHPLWQIKADKVVHNEADKTIDYKNARLDFMGVPVAIAPFFSHADPSVTRKSGLTRPQYGYTSKVGGYVQGGYYFGDIAPNIDATVQIRPTTLEGTLLLGEYRQRFESGSIVIDGSYANSDRKEEDGRVEQDRDRGHVFANGLFDLSDTWRAGFDVQRASDKEYLRLYDIAKDNNVLQSDAYAERFSGRDYTRIDTLTFQDVRLGIRPDQPIMLPSLEHRMYGEPDALFGGRWTAGLQTLELHRDGVDQDMQRGSVDLGWQRRDVSSLGTSTTFNLSGRGDFYSVQDSDASKTDPTLDPDNNSSRGMAVASVTTSYPLVKRLAKSQVVIEPQVGASLSPRIHQSLEDEPNEDSIDVQLDTNNLFSDNRFPGIDRQEDGARVNYGMKAGIYGDNGRYGKVFIGQSYRFNNDNPFPDGSGLEDQASDVVGQINASVSKYLSGDYRFQLDNSLVVHRHELQIHAGNDIVNVNTKYIFIDPVAGTGFTESRQQALTDGTYRLNDKWWLNAGVLADFGEEPGIRRGGAGINYGDECFTFSLQGSRNNINEASGENGTVLMMRIGFKNIGEFSGPSIQLAKSDETTN
ncbi:MAG: LPS assembly protein LptD [Micavibrio sp.]|nr:LPS assembly protein LptD [Micavibrio sp.]